MVVVVVVVMVEEKEAVWFDVGDPHEAWRLVIPLFLMKFTDEGKLVTDRPTDGPMDGHTLLSRTRGRI